MTQDHPTHPRATGDPRPVCLLTAVHPERSLSRALLQHLGQELPDLRFVLEPPDDGELRAIWVCGYEAGRGAIVAQLRERHPDAVLVVTGRGPVETWSAEVERSGGDFACAWPLPVGRLASLLSSTRADATSGTRTSGSGIAS